MQIKFSGLKCDNQQCNYRDDSIIFSDYASLVGSRCPKCNEVWLTQEDYEKCIKMYNFIALINKVGGVLKWLNPFHYWRLMFGDHRGEITLWKKW